jgi:hypothetical protein
LIEKCDHKIDLPTVLDDFAQFAKIRAISAAQQKGAATGDPLQPALSGA